MSRALPLLLSLGLLTACAPELPVRVSENLPPDNTPLGQRIAKLEESAVLLRHQHEAMGETIQWIDGEIGGLKAQQGETPQTAAHEEQQPQQLVAHPAEPQPARAETTHATEQNVAALNEDDLEISAETATQAGEENQAADLPGGRFYLVHLASYLHESQVAPGWRQIEAKQGGLLTGLSPYTTGFTDTRGRHWLRLNAGTLPSRTEATQRCDALKATGEWCDVVEATANSASAVQTN